MVLKNLLSSEAGKRLAGNVLGKMLHKEIKYICSDEFDSILREKSQAAMEQFSWDSIWLELEGKAIIFTTLLKNAVKSFTNQTKKSLIMCMSMILKSQNRNMCAVQAMVSLILYAGHAGKQVCTTNS